MELLINKYKKDEKVIYIVNRVCGLFIGRV